MLERIIYIHRMEKLPPTDKERVRLGFPDFLAELRKHGWVDEGNRAITLFSYVYDFSEEPGNSYIRFTAFPREE